MELLFSPLTHCFDHFAPKQLFQKCQELWRCQVKCFLLYKFISLLYTSSGHSEAEAFPTVGTLTQAILYSLAMGSDLALLSRSYFLPLLRLSRHFSYSPFAYSSHSEIESSATSLIRCQTLAPDIFDACFQASQVSLEDGKLQFLIVQSIEPYNTDRITLGTGAEKLVCGLASFFFSGKDTVMLLW